MSEPAQPRPHRRDASSSSLHSSGIPRPHRHHSASASAEGRNGRDGAYERQLEDYCRDLEEDHTELREAYNEQVSEAERYRALTREYKFREDVVRSLDAQVALCDGFLKEMQTTLADGRGLRQRGDSNVPRQGGKAPKTEGDMAAVMDSIRAALQKQSQQLRALQKEEDLHRRALQAAESEVAALKKRAAARADGKQRTDDDEEEDYIVPASAQEQKELRERLRTAERQLATAEREARQLTTELKKSQQEVKVTAVQVNLQESELKELRFRVDAKEKLIAEAEKRYRAAEERLQRGDTAGPEGTTAAAPAARSGTSTKTKHYCFLRGKPYTLAWLDAPDAFRDALVKSIAGVAQVTPSAVSEVEVLHSAEGVSVELAIRHPSALTAEELDTRLLRHPFQELEGLAAQAQARAQHQRVREAMALAAELQETKEALTSAQKEAAALTKRLRDLEASMERRDASREDNDKEIAAMLTETEETVKETYAAYEREAARAQQLQEEVATHQAKAEQAAAVTQELKDQLAESESALGRRNNLLKAAETKLRAAEKEAEQLRQTVQQLEGTSAAQVEDLRQQLGKAQEEVETLTKQKTAMRKALEADKAKYDTMCKQAGAGEEQKAKLLEAELARSRDLARQLDDLAAVCDRGLPKDVAQQAGTLAQKAEMLANAARNTQSALAQQREKNAELEKQVKTQQTDMAALQQQLATLASSAETSSQRTSTASAAAITRLESELKRQEQRAKREQDALLAKLEKAEKAAAKAAAAAAPAAVQAPVPSEWEKELQAALEAKEAEVAKLLQEVERARRVEKRLIASKLEQEAQLKKLQRGSTQAGSSTRASRLAPANPEDPVADAADGASPRFRDDASNRASLEEELRTARRDNSTLSQQVKEMETDISGFGKIQSDLQASLEEAQRELRAKRHDMDTLVKQLLRMEENEQRMQEQLTNAVAVAAMHAGSNKKEEAQVRTPIKSMMPPTTPNCHRGGAADAGSPTTVMVTPPSRILKRSQSATVFGRSASSHDALGANSRTKVTEAPRPSNESSHGVRRTRGSAGGSGGDPAAADGAPRLDSGRPHYTNAQQGVLHKNRNSADDAAASRQQQQQQQQTAAAAAANASAAAAAANASAAASRRRINSPGSGGKNFQRSNTATTTTGTSFVRTPSGYQRVVITPDKLMKRK